MLSIVPVLCPLHGQRQLPWLIVFLYKANKIVTPKTVSLGGTAAPS